METRRISAHYIFPGHSNALKYGIIEFDSTGLILNLIDTGGTLKETAGLEFYTGIITPGFIISPFLKDLRDLNMEIPEFPWVGEFFSLVGDIMNEGIADETVESPKILKYMYVIQEQNPSMDMQELISLVTYQAARGIGKQDKFGSLEPGKKPGINLLTRVDLQKLKLTDETKVVRIG